jgi:hypothetical protein
MSDNINQNNNNQSSVLKELSDIKANLAVNNTETSNIKTSVAILETHHVEIKETLQRIEAQTVRTNGRVGVLEIWKSNRNGWIAGFGIAVLVIIGLTSYIFNSSINRLDNEIIKHTQQK